MGATHAVPTVELAWGDTYRTVSKTWVDVTTYVRKVKIRGPGRDDEFGTTQPGTATVLFDNADRRFEPGYTSGAYSPDVVPLVPIRISVTYSAVTSRLFYGFVRGWPLAYEGDGVDAVVEVACVDATAVLSRYTFDTYRELVAADGAIAHWPLYEMSGSSFADVIGGHTGSWQTAPAAMGVAATNEIGPGGSYVGGSQDPLCVRLDEDTSDGRVGEAPDLWLAGDMTFEMWIYHLGGSHQWQILMACARAGDQCVWRVTKGVAAALEFGWDTTSGSISVGTAFAFAHVVFVRDVAAKSVTIYRDGVRDNAPVQIGTWIDPVATPQLASSTTMLATTVGPGGFVFPLGIGLGASYPFEAEVNNVAIYPHKLSAAQILAHYQAQWDRLPAETTGVRLARILDAAGWPTGASYRNLDAGIETMAATIIDGNTSFLDHIRTVEQAEGGQFWIDGAGVAQFRDRWDRAQNQQTSQGTFGDGGGSERPFLATIRPSEDDNFIYNIVRVRHATGQVVSEDATSQDTYWPATLSIDLGFQSVDDAQQLADWTVSRYKDPRLRLPQIQVQPERDPANLYPLLFGLTVGERVTVMLRPPGGGTARTLFQFIERIDHEFVADNWLVPMALSPVENFQMMILDDAEYGKLDAYPLGY